MSDPTDPERDEITDPETIIEERMVDDDGAYVVTDCGSVLGSLCSVTATAEINEGPLEIEGVYEAGGWSGVGLYWHSGPLAVRTGFTPDAARELASRLLVAADSAEGDSDE